MEGTEIMRIVFLMTAVVLLAGCAAMSSSSGTAPDTTTSSAVPSAAAAPATPEPITGDAESGRAIFMGEREIEGFLPCATCHYVDPDKYILVGPNMSGLGARAGTRVEGLSAAAYLRESIREPDAYVVEGFPAGTMNQKYDYNLTEEDVNDLIAYLMTL